MGRVIAADVFSPLGKPERLAFTVLFAGLSQAWNILGGYCGQISLGHALYLGVGGYVSSKLFVDFGVSPVFGMFAGGAVAGA